MTKTKNLEIIEVANVMKSLPAEKVTEIKDFVLFLRDKYSQKEVVDENDEWSEEDFQDFGAASFEYFEETEINEVTG